MKLAQISILVHLGYKNPTPSAETGFRLFSITYYSASVLALSDVDSY